MKKRFFCCFIVALTIMGWVQKSSAAPQKPNIVFILADDLGYGEVGCFGQKKIKTPNLDQLARDGMMLTQHYTGAPVCAPARCILMTGLNLAHAEIRGNRDAKNGRIYPGQWPISDKALTIAEVLKKAGYATGAFGKWGLGPNRSTGAPNNQGFDRYYGYICQRNAHSYYPLFLDSDGREVLINKNPVFGHQKKPKGEVVADDYRAKNYAPDLILAEALKFIDKNKDKPFFLYLPFVEPHVAMQPHQKSIDQYPKEWDTKPYRGDRGYMPHPRPHAAYAAMISDFDRHVGAVLKRLKKYGLDQNTIVIFTSDNGPTHNVGGVETEFFDSMAGLRGYKSANQPGYGTGGKGSCYEGGIRMPTIVRWPGKVKAGSTSDIASYAPDWFPTLCDVAGTPTPKNLDGVSLLGVLEGAKTLPKRSTPMMWEFHDYGGIIAIREGKWKAIRRGLKRKELQDWELYDIQADRNETTNLADQFPEVVKRLEKSWLDNRIANPTFRLPIVDKK